MRALLGERDLRDWESFAASWDNLGVDAYMADGGRYRRRRFAALRATPMGIMRKPHQPHYQSRDYNTLNGGIERWFEPVTDAVAGHPALNAVLRTSLELFDRKTLAEVRPEAWHVEVHQFRIEARAGQPGSRRPKACTATAWTACWCCWSAARTSPAARPRSTTGEAPARQLHPDPTVRLGAGRRQPRCFTASPRSSRSNPFAGLSRRAGGDVPPGIIGISEP